jgi:Ca-activated chloride channel family protein
MFRFAHPWFFLLLLPLAGLWVLAVRWHRRRKPTFRSTLVAEAVAGGPGFWARLRALLPVLEALALVLLVAGLARPQFGLHETDIRTEGIDIALALDTSGSMLAEDFSEGSKRKNRLTVAKETIARFVDGRRDDRIGLVVFAEAAYTKVPLTLDYDLLGRMLRGVEIDRKSGKTAIGMALATALNRLKHSEAETRIVILLTDGRNNAGSLNPADAAQLAASMEIKVYTIGVGRKGRVPFPREDPIFGKSYTMRNVDIDEDTLIDIAKTTGGRYFRAVDLDTLRGVFDTIDELEKSEILVREYSLYRELFSWFALPAAVLLLGGLLMETTRLRRLP